jgi:hypothetical protein
LRCTGQPATTELLAQTGAVEAGGGEVVAGVAGGIVLDVCGTPRCELPAQAVRQQTARSDSRLMSMGVAP